MIIWLQWIEATCGIWLVFVGNDPLHKVSLLMSYTSTPHDVADPWFTGNFEDTWRDVLAGCTALLERLCQ